MESNTNDAQKSELEQAGAKIINVGDLLSYLLRVKDGRKRRGIRYSVRTILVIFILAKLCGQNKVYGIADWAQQRSSFSGGSIAIETQAFATSQHIPAY